MRDSTFKFSFPRTHILAVISKGPVLSDLIFILVTYFELEFFYENYGFLSYHGENMCPSKNLKMKTLTVIIIIGIINSNSVHK